MKNNYLHDYVAEAQLILKYYPVQVLLLKKYHCENNKAVWFVKTHDKNLALKRYDLTKEQWNKMISVYYFFSQNGVNIAPLVTTKDYKTWVSWGNKYYILSNWVKINNPDFKAMSDIIKLTQGVANIHLCSKNYSPKSRDYKDKYTEIRRKQGLLLEYRYEAENNLTDSFSQIYLQNFQYFFDLWESIGIAFKNELYDKWLSMINKQPCICLNSFSPQNFSLDNNSKLWLLHLDNVCIDLPILDLRQLLFKIMYIREAWDEQIFINILKEYLKIYPLNNDQLTLLLADLKTPHLFFNVATNYFLFSNNEQIKNRLTNSLLKAIKLEKEKINLLKNFWNFLSV